MISLDFGLVDFLVVDVDFFFSTICDRFSFLLIKRKAPFAFNHYEFIANERDITTKKENEKNAMRNK